MNIIDIIILACLVIGAVMGFRDGVIRQLGSLAGIIIAIFLARGFGNKAAALLQIQGDNSHIWGFVIVLILSLIAAAFITSLLRKLISAVGLGIIDRLAGAALGALKSVLLLSLALLAFSFLNSTFGMVESSQVTSSKLYTPTVSVSQYILPSIEWVGQNIPIPEIE